MGCKATGHQHHIALSQGGAGEQVHFLATFSTQIGTVCSAADLEQDLQRFSKNGYKRVRLRPAHNSVP